MSAIFGDEDTAQLKAGDNFHLENALGKLKKALDGTADIDRPTELIRNADELLLHRMRSGAAGGVASFFRFWR